MSRDTLANRGPPDLMAFGDTVPYPPSPFPECHVLFEWPCTNWPPRIMLDNEWKSHNVFDVLRLLLLISAVMSAYDFV